MEQNTVRSFSDLFVHVAPEVALLASFFVPIFFIVGYASLEKNPHDGKEDFGIGLEYHFLTSLIGTAVAVYLFQFLPREIFSFIGTGQRLTEVFIWFVSTCAGLLVPLIVLFATRIWTPFVQGLDDLLSRADR